MKKIKIVFDGFSETLFDPDESNLEEYSKSVAFLFTSGNVNIIQADNEAVLVRPSKVIAVKVTDVVDKVKEKKTEEIEDTVTDQ